MIDYKLILIKPIGKRIEGLPLLKRRLFEALVDAALPIRYIRDFVRLQRLRKVGSGSNNFIDRNSGWAKFQFNNELTERFTRIAQAIRSNYLENEEKQINKKEYLQQIANLDIISAQYPEILEFALQESLLKTIGNYFGRFPILHDISVFYSPPQKTKEVSENWQGSQLFHRDGGGTRCFKLWLLCEAVTMQNGPTTLLPADVSDEICQKLNYVPGKKFETDEPLRHYLSGQVSLIGPKGSWFATDTDRCLHYGSRTTESSSRLVMMFHYVDRNSVYYLPFLSKHYNQKRNLDRTNLKTKVSGVSLSALR